MLHSFHLVLKTSTGITVSLKQNQILAISVEEKPVLRIRIRFGLAIFEGFQSPNRYSEQGSGSWYRYFESILQFSTAQ